MIWQVVAVWAIVLAVVVWFVRDERKRRELAVLDRAARFYAQAPQYRHVRVDAERTARVIARTQPAAELKPVEKRFLEKLSSRAVLVLG